MDWFVVIPIIFVSATLGGVVGFGTGVIALSVLAITLGAAEAILVLAIWFWSMNQEGGEVIKAYARWEIPDAPVRTAPELVRGLKHTLEIMHEAIARWTPEEWKNTWPGADDGTEPVTVTREWVIWHLLEHDLHHGGEITITLRSHGVPTIEI